MNLFRVRSEQNGRASHLLLGLLLVHLLYSGAATAGQPATRGPSPFDKHIRLDLWGRNLRDALSQITERGHIDVQISPHLIHPRQYTDYTLYLHADRITLRQAIEWLCRSIGCRYRIDGARSVWLTGSYDWLRSDRDEVLIEPLGPVLGRSGDIDSLYGIIYELVKVHSLFPTYWIRIEEEDGQLVASLPAHLKSILKRSLVAMSKPGRSISEPVTVTLSKEETDIYRALRTTVVVRYRNWSLREAIADLALQSGINIGFTPHLLIKNGEPTIDLDLGQVTLRAAVEQLVEKIGFKGYEISPPAGIFLTETKRKWSRAASRAFLWEALKVEAYAIGELAVHSSGDAVAHHLRRRVLPDTWLDPCTAITFHPASRNLVVVAPEEAQRAVLAELKRMLSETAKSND